MMKSWKTRRWAWHVGLLLKLGRHNAVPIIDFEGIHLIRGSVLTQGKDYYVQVTTTTDVSV